MIRPSPRSGVLALLAATFVAAPAPAFAAPPRPDLERVKAAILIDARDGDVLLRKKATERRQMASTTKLMTALLALERARLDDVFAAPPYAALPAESKIGLREGEHMRVEDLLEALLLESANDAAVTIAEGVGPSRAAFVERMNRRAHELGLADTSYANPIGLDDPQNYSTARDLAKLARRLLRDRHLARIVDLPSAVLESGARRRTVENRNDLVRRYGFVDGVKTGHTTTAGYVLIGAAEGDAGRKVISVVMGEPSEAARDVDSLALLRFGLAQFRSVRALRTGRAVAHPKIKYRDERAPLVPRRSLSVAVRKGERLERRVSAPKKLEGPIPARRRVGSVAVLLDGELVRRVDLVTASEVPGAGILRIVTSPLGVPLTLLLIAGMLVGATAVGARRLGVRLRLVRGEEERHPTAAP